MRILDFTGEIPKVKPQDLPQNGAQLAVNVDLYGGLLRPHRRPAYVTAVVSETGGAYDGTPAMFIPVGSYMVGFAEEVSWVYDPRHAAGRDTVLFVRDGRVWRLSPRLVADGIGPVEVGIVAPEQAPVASILKGQGCKVEWDSHTCDTQDKDCGGDTPELRAYRVTYLNDCNEESAPSPVSEPIEIYNGDGATIVDINTPPANAVARRWYRSATTSDGNTLWLYVGQSTLSEVSYVDDRCASELGEVLPTEDHNPPPECAEGIALATNMRTVVWSGKQFWVSEAGLPHAYTPRCRVLLMYDIVFMASHTPLVEENWHYNIVAVTEGYPYALDVKDDGLTGVKELEYWYPGLSPFAWTVLNGNVIYSCDAGLVALHGTHVQLITSDFMTEREWAQFRPTSVRLTGYDQRLFIWYDLPEAGKRSGALIVSTGQDSRRTASLSRLTLPITMAVASPDVGMRMLLGSGIYLWGAGTGNMRYTWWSTIEVNSGYWFPTVFKAVGDLPFYNRNLQQVTSKFTVWKKQNCSLQPEQFFDAYPEYRKYMVQLLNDTVDVEVTLYCDGKEYYNRGIHYDAPIMIPRKCRGVEWSVKISGSVVIRELHLQKSRNDLVNDGGHA